MSNTVNSLLQDYLDQLRQKAAVGPLDTIASEAKALGISAGTLSQLRNKKAITSRVIGKIAKKISSGDEPRRREIEAELERARQSETNAASTSDSLGDVDKFLETGLGQRRLICIAYRDIPQSRDKGDYPGYIDRSAEFVKEGLSFAMFQVFGPLQQIKKKAKAAYDNDDVEGAETWNYVYRLASGVREVFSKMKKAVERDGEGAGHKAGQIVLYETMKTPPLIVSNINSRVFYSHQISERGDERRIRIAQLIRAKDKEILVEFANDSAYESAVAAQFQPILQFWVANSRLPTKKDQLKAYRYDDDGYSWNILNDTDD